MSIKRSPFLPTTSKFNNHLPFVNDVSMPKKWDVQFSILLIFAARFGAMKKIYHLSSCNTCQRIIKELNINDDIELQDIKEENIEEKTLDMLKEKVGSYEALFSKRAMKYRSMGLNEMELSESDFKKYMLQEYTFLKRPFIIIEDQVFVGNSKKVIEAAKQAYQGA